MEQELGTSLLSTAKAKDGHSPDNDLFGGEKDRISRRWHRKAAHAAAPSHTNSRLACAKSIVEQIVANRQSFEHDRYMLVTYNDTGSGCIRSNLKDSRATLLSELNKLQAKDRFYGGMSLAALFNQLSLMRSAYDLDTYGYGRYPALNEPVHIVWLTDGASVVTPSGVSTKLNLPVNNTHWVESYVEPFRWDQRLILVFLHEAGDEQLCGNKKHSSEGMLMPMCKVMGGTMHHVGSMRQAQRFVDSFAPSRAAPNSGRSQGQAMAAPGVLVNFERIDDNPANPGNTDLRVLLHASPCSIASAPLPPPTEGPGPGQAGAGNGGAKGAGATSYGNSAGVTALINGHLGYFPIPESFWPETIHPPRAPGSNPPPNSQTPLPPPGVSGWQIPRRSAHPTLCYSQNNTDWAVPPQFPFDKYQIDTNSSVAQKLLMAAQAAQAAHEAQGGKGPAKPVCWQVFVNGSYTNPKYAGFPFGILRPNTARTAVNLFVLPYNFTALWKILGKLDLQAQGQHATRSAVAMSPSWRREFEEYLQHTPGYYAIPLKRAFNLYGIPHGVFPKTFGQSPGMRNATHYSMKLHTVARKEWERLQPMGGPDSASGGGGQALAEIAANLQSALLTFDPASDASHLVSNAFDVDRSHCLATLSAMRRVFVRECMLSQSAYFRANAIVPPSPPLALLQSSGSESSLSGEDQFAMDTDSDKVPQRPQTPPPQFTPPVASMEYSFYGLSQALDGSLVPPFTSQPGSNRSQSGPMGRQRGAEPDPQHLVPGAQLSPLGGVVDVASEDDRDSRHSVPIRDMGEYGAAMHRLKSYEARDPLLDERTALLQRRNMFGNPYRRPLREPRGPNNNVLARNPELSAKLGLSRTPLKAAGAGNGQPKSEPDDEASIASLEMESEAEVNEFAMDKMIEDMPMDAEGSGRSAGGDHRNEPSPGGQEGIAAGRYGWMQRRDVPRRRSISTAWRKNDESWNVNPWAIIASSGAGNESPADPGSLTFTSDSTIINKNTAQIIKPASSGSPGQGSGQPAAPLPPPTSHPDNDTQDAAMVAAVDTVEQGGAQSDNSEGAHSAARTTNLTPSRSTIPPGSSGSGEKSTLPQENVEVAEAEPLVSSAPSPSSMEGSLTATAESSISSKPAAEPASQQPAIVRKVNVAEEKAWFLKRIKADPAHYDEDAILQHLTELRGNQGLGKAQLKIIITAAASAAKAMRRKHLVDRLGEAAKAAS